MRRLLPPPLLIPPPLLPPMVPTQSMEFVPPPLLLLPKRMLEFFRFPRPLLVAPSAGCCRATDETRAAPSLLLVVWAVVVGIMVCLAFGLL